MRARARREASVCFAMTMALELLAVLRASPAVAGDTCSTQFKSTEVVVKTRTDRNFCLSGTTVYTVELTANRDQINVTCLISSDRPKLENGVHGVLG